MRLINHHLITVFSNSTIRSLDVILLFQLGPSVTPRTSQLINSIEHMTNQLMGCTWFSFKMSCANYMCHMTQLFKIMYKYILNNN